jgi:hypothetical protein
MGRPSLGPEPDIAPDPIQRHTQIEAAKRRNVERQNKLQADSDKISRLAKELSSSVEPVAKTADPPAMAKKVEEIEKLARSVKELMKSD